MTVTQLDTRSAPVDCLYDVHWARRLKTAGYATVGDVIDATPKALADRLYAVGPKRAIKIRQRALDYVIGFETARQQAEFYQIEVETTPSLVDAIATIGSLLNALTTHHPKIIRPLQDKHGIVLTEDNRCVSS